MIRNCPFQQRALTSESEASGQTLWLRCSGQVRTYWRVQVALRTVSFPHRRDEGIIYSDLDFCSEGSNLCANDLLGLLQLGTESGLQVCQRDQVSDRMGRPMHRPLQVSDHKICRFKNVNWLIPWVMDMYKFQLWIMRTPNGAKVREQEETQLWLQVPHCVWWSKWECLWRFWQEGLSEGKI